MARRRQLQRVQQHTSSVTGQTSQKGNHDRAEAVRASMSRAWRPAWRWITNCSSALAAYSFVSLIKSARLVPTSERCWTLATGKNPVNRVAECSTERSLQALPARRSLLRCSNECLCTDAAEMECLSAHRRLTRREAIRFRMRSPPCRTGQDRARARRARRDCRDGHQARRIVLARSICAPGPARLSAPSYSQC